MAEVKFTELERQDIYRIAVLPYAWDKLRNSTILISGAGGFIGSHLVAVLEERNNLYHDNIHIIGLSRHPQPNSQWLENVVCDVVDPIALTAPVNYIVHLASNTHPKQYASDPVGTVTTNIFGCKHLLDIAREKKAKRFLLASSVEIYGNGATYPMDESYCGYIDCNTSRAGYNEAKRVSESLCQAYRQQYGVECVIARLSRVFGADKKQDTKALAQFMQKAINREDIILKSKGDQTFSYCYVADAVSGLLKVLLDGSDGEAYNVSAEAESKTLRDYAEIIAGFADKKVVIDVVDDIGASKASYAVLDCGKLKSLGWQPLYGVSDALKRTYHILSEYK